MTSLLQTCFHPRFSMFDCCAALRSKRRCYCDGHLNPKVCQQAQQMLNLSGQGVQQPGRAVGTRRQGANPTLTSKLQLRRIDLSLLGNTRFLFCIDMRHAGLPDFPKQSFTQFIGMSRSRNISRKSYAHAHVYDTYLSSYLSIYLSIYIYIYVYIYIHTCLYT